MNGKMALAYLAAAAAICALAFGGYSAWNYADPEYTCVQCHEIKPSHEKWKNSAHAGVSCAECHGTAVSNGLHSLKEKAGMVFSHFSKDVSHSDIKLTERQRLDIMERCAACHEDEFAKWRKGAHSTTYANIFEDKAHNSQEKPYWDCLRCHGMFYGGNIHSLMSLDRECESWKIRDENQRGLPAIPCMACHQIHSEKPKIPNFENGEKSRIPACAVPRTSFYSRADGAHFRTDRLMSVKRYLEGREVGVSQDPNAKLCYNCHSPNWTREAGTSDDRTPVGAHEGMSCVVCHDPHSNSAANSCAKCHDSSDEKYKFKPGKCPKFALGAK